MNNVIKWSISSNRHQVDRFRGELWVKGLNTIFGWGGVDVGWVWHLFIMLVEVIVVVEMAFGINQMYQSFGCGVAAYGIVTKGELGLRGGKGPQ